VIRKLADDGMGLNPLVQWEVVVQRPTNYGRADITFQGQDGIDVYELKLLDSSSYPRVTAQVASYVDAFNTAGVSPDARLGQPSGGALPAEWVDSFFTPTPTFDTCETKAKDTVYKYRLHLSWVTAPGVVTIWWRDLDCFDPTTEAPPVPEPVSVNLPGVGWRTVPTDSVPAGVQPGAPNGGRPYPGDGTGSGGGSGSGSTLDPIPLPPGGGISDGPVGPSFPGPGAGAGLPTPPGGGQGGSLGDPHLRSLDGLGFDFQAVGEFELVQSEPLGLDLQARLTPRGNNASVVDRLAFELNGYRVEIEPSTGALYIGGSQVTLPDGFMFDLGDGAAIIRKGFGASYYVSWPGAGPRPALYVAAWFMQVYVPPGSDGVSGLLGNADGNPANDLIMSGGEQLPSTASAATIHGALADSWRLGEDESLFSYAQDQSTETFTDRSFPPNLLTVGDLSDGVLADATTHCADANVMDGQQFDDCVLDWALTRDQSFVDAAAADTTPSVEGGARQIGTDGVVSEDFENSVAPNFSSARYGSGAGTGRFAGPMGSGGRYVFYVPSLPGHTSATVDFDVIALGGWPGDGTSHTTVTVDGATAWSGDVSSRTPSASGVTSSGQPYAVYPMTITAPQADEQLNVGISTSFPIGSARSFGIDNVHAQFALVPAQSFDVTLPFTVSDGLPGAGAGNLETIGSEDRYRFSINASKALQIDPSACASALGDEIQWRLVDESSSAAVATGDCTSKLTSRLSAGDYRLVVREPGKTGTYSVALREATPPQTFDVSVPILASDGFPSTGAGNIETTSSQDDYVFSTATLGGVILDFAGCSSGLAGRVDWKLVHTATDAVIDASSSCDSRLVSNVPAGTYRLEVTRNGRTGTYAVSIDLQPPPQVFEMTLPASVSDGVPVTGAGRLETTASEDRYLFSTTSAGGVQIDLSTCSSTLDDGVSWKLSNVDTGEPVRSGASCGSQLVSNVAGGSYVLEVWRSGRTGTYRLGISIQPPSEVFDLTAPTTVADGVPSAGAGRLETTSSQDNYNFATPAAGAVQVNFSGCSSGLTGVSWKLVDLTTGAAVFGPQSTCSSSLLSDVPAGYYRIEVSKNGSTGTYGFGLVTAAPDVFNVSLPASISDGVPAAGAGNLETTASEDRYEFSTTSTGGVQVDFSGCSASLGGDVSWSLTNTDTGTTVTTGAACDSRLVSNVSAGHYRLAVWRTGAAGTYRFSISAQPPPDVFDLTALATVSNGVPSAGAGSLETTSSQDNYNFATPDAGAVQVNFSGCSASLGSVTWKLVNRTTGATVFGPQSTCSSSLLSDVPAGSYRIEVSKNGSTGTYGFGLVTAAPDLFDVSLPVSISDGVPAAGAGRLETTASEDRYEFSTTSAGGVQIDLSTCSASLGGYVSWRLTEADTGSTVTAGVSCASQSISNVSAGHYRLAVWRTGQTGTYKVILSARPDPDVFDLTASATVSNGVPGAGAGNLETTASQDHYNFSTTTAGAVQVSFSGCSASLGSVSWKLVNRTTGATVFGPQSTCSSSLLSDVPAGSYRIEVSKNGSTGTYGFGLVTASPDVFNVSLPGSISNGVPAAGAGNLETTASEDRYEFSTTSSGGVQVDFSSCSASLGGYVSWRLTNADTGSTVTSGVSCSSQLLSNVPTGHYRLAVWRTGAPGTYRLSISAQPPPDVVDLTAPATVSDGVPSAGAGNLETTSSQDHYNFSTTAVGAVQVNFSGCSGSLGSVSWKLVNRTTGATVFGPQSTCSSSLLSDVPAGSYRIEVSKNGLTGTYGLGLVTAAPDAFNMSLPASVSDGLPAAGAGNLETTASEDRYEFSTTSSGGVQVDFSSCSASLGGYVSWRLTNADTGSTVTSGVSCSSQLVSNVPAGHYRLAVWRTGAPGTYRLSISAQPPPDVFALTAPATVSDGVPSGGAGNLETTSSQDHYNFSTTTAGAVQANFSGCSTSLGSVSWKLVNRTTGATVFGPQLTCSSSVVPNVSAGNYRVEISRNGVIGTYGFGLVTAG
jgi:hypothetical protein